MDFKKDLLLVDLEFSGLDIGRHEIIQIAAVLLDRKTLKEKKTFGSFIKPVKWKNRDMESMRVNKITWDQVKNAPSLKKVVLDFDRMFGHNVVLSYYGGPMDMDFMRQAYKTAKVAWRFDYHFFNIWGTFFTRLAVKNLLKNSKRFTGFALEDLMKRFNIKSNKRHDALEDCRIEAEILRRIIKEIK